MNSKGRASVGNSKEQHGFQRQRPLPARPWKNFICQERESYVAEEKEETDEREREGGRERKTEKREGRLLHEKARLIP